MRKQIYHHYERWEDYKAGMWRKETKKYEEQEFNKVVKFTGNDLLYGNAMLRVIDEWKISCEHNLSNMGINRKAWIGRAACCIQYGWPEYFVRQAWGMLTDEQRNKANEKARLAILKWEEMQNEKLSKNKFIQLKFPWWNNL